MHNQATSEDVCAILGDTFTLFKPRASQFGQLSVDRLIFFLPSIIPQETIGQWISIFSNKELNAEITSHSLQIARIIEMTKQSVLESSISSQTRIQTLANILGMLFREIRIFDKILLNPSHATDYLRKMFDDVSIKLPIKYSTKEMEIEEWNQYIDLMNAKMVHSHQYYFEIVVPRSIDFRLGNGLT